MDNVAHTNDEGTKTESRDALTPIERKLASLAVNIGEMRDQIDVTHDSAAMMDVNTYAALCHWAYLIDRDLKDVAHMLRTERAS